ncbi:GNAT family N-acetyltransferase [bacterium]|nr:GNAT family N-acetyltransferase [bacterium]
MADLIELRLSAEPGVCEQLAELWDDPEADFSVEKLTDSEKAVFSLFLKSEDEVSQAERKLLETAKFLTSDLSLEKRIVKKEDWAEKWKENFHVSRVGKNLVIVPSWETYSPEPNDIILVNDPGMAFGTGSHGTSKACLEFLEELANQSKPASLLDAGTGTGILAVAGAKLGIKTIDAFDNEPQAVMAAKENAEKNQVADKISVFQQDLFFYAPNKKYDIVIANILCAVLERNVERLLAAVAPGGHLVLAGILDEQYPALSILFTRLGAMEQRSTLIEGWRTGVFKIPQNLRPIETVPQTEPEMEEAASWFSDKWHIPKSAYLASMKEPKDNYWYVIRDPETKKIIAGAGVIPNDFHMRPDLAPNVCAVFVEEPHRKQGLAGALLNHIARDMQTSGCDTLYLATEHTSFYERYGWEFYTFVKESNSDHMTRLYRHIWKDERK